MSNLYRALFWLGIAILALSFINFSGLLYPLMVMLADVPSFEDGVTVGKIFDWLVRMGFIVVIFAFIERLVRGG